MDGMEMRWQMIVGIHRDDDLADRMKPAHVGSNPENNIVRKLEM
jgi:hypothetical protein